MQSQANRNRTRNRTTYQGERQKLVDLIETRIPKKANGVTPDFTQFTRLAMIMRDPIVSYFGIRDTDQLIQKYNELLSEIVAEQYGQENVAVAPVNYAANAAMARNMQMGYPAPTPTYYNANASYARQLAQQNNANAAMARELAEQNAALARQLAEQNNANAAFARQLAEQNAAMARQIAEQNAAPAAVAYPAPGHGAEGGKKKRTVRRKTTKKKRSVKK